MRINPVKNAFRAPLRFNQGKKGNEKKLEKLHVGNFINNSLCIQDSECVQDSDDEFKTAQSKSFCSEVGYVTEPE